MPRRSRTFRVFANAPFSESTSKSVRAMNMKAGKKTVTVVGGGVSGLTTAICLQQAGYEVEIVTREVSPFTTSDKAVAIWLPYASGPADKVEHWSRETYLDFKKLSKDPDSGVYFVELLLLAEDVNEVEPGWSLSLPSGSWRVAEPTELPAGYDTAFAIKVPLIETPIYLPYLLSRFQADGGAIHMRMVSRLEELLVPGKWVVNCTGLEAKALTGDTELYPIKGNIIVGKIQGDEPWLRYLVDNAGQNKLAYILPRKRTGDIVLGGTAIEYDHSPEFSSTEVSGIYARCLKVIPELKDLPVNRMDAGLRPGRKKIRLGWDAELRGLIHNYGHGGSGFTVAWGCGRAVLGLVEKVVS
jgi:D-amino-acid oxidase